MTIDREIACFWSFNRTLASSIFFANRYISLAAYIGGLVSFTQIFTDKVSSPSTHVSYPFMTRTFQRSVVVI